MDLPCGPSIPSLPSSPFIPASAVVLNPSFHFGAEKNTLLSYAAINDRTYIFISLIP